MFAHIVLIVHTEHSAIDWPGTLLWLQQQMAQQNVRQNIQRWNIHNRMSIDKIANDK